MPSGSRLRMSLSRTKRSMDSVSRPTAASSAPISSLGPAGAAPPSTRAVSASAFWAMPRMRPVTRSPITSPPSAPRLPAAAVPKNSQAAARSASWALRLLMNGRARKRT